MSIVLLKSHLSRTGGAEKYTWALAHALKKRNYDVTLLTTGAQTLDPPDFKIVSCSNSPFSFQLVRKFDSFCASYLKKYPTPLVFGLDRNRFQTHLRASNGVHAAFLQYRRENGSPLRNLSFSFNPLHRTLLKIEKESFENPHLRCLITNSHMVKNEILEHYTVDPIKIKVVHNGVEWQEMESSFCGWPEGRANLLQKLKLKSDRFHFLFIGHNYQRKGLETVLEGLKLLSPKGDAFHLSVVGKDKNLSEFIARVAQWGLSDHVSFFGAQRDVKAFYQLADALIIPSFYDPFANVTVEALAMGVPVISSKTNGGHEILTPDNGIIIENLKDPYSLKSALAQALKKPKTWENSQQIRSSIAHLDFSLQLDKLLRECGL